MSIPIPGSERNFYKDGTADFFAYRSGPKSFDRAVQNIVRGRADRVEIGFSDGSTTVVKPKTTHIDLLHRLRAANAIEARAIWKEARERGVTDALERAYRFGFKQEERER